MLAAVTAAPMASRTGCLRSSAASLSNHCALSFGTPLQRGRFLNLGSRQFFKHLNDKLKSHSSIPNLCSEGKIIVNDKDKATEFLNTFKCSFTADNGKLGNIPSAYCVPTNITPDFSVLNVSKHLKSVKPASAPGPDGLPGCFWHNLHAALAFPLSIIFNRSFACGILPSLWKHSNITPVFKKGDSLIASNYRPISLTSIACKCMESIVCDALLDHFKCNNLLSPEQHGFLNKHSTGTQLLECLDDWTDAVEHSDCVDVCYIDFARAFDSVSLPKLVQKLTAYGVSGLCLKWLNSFLTNRTMCVKVNRACSDSVVQQSGIPQGSVLGPFCFFVFMNDLPNVVKFCKLKLYADDVKLYFRYSPGAWSNLLQRDLNAIVEWSNMWQLCISAPKTFILHIGSKNTRNVYNINGAAIGPVDSIKDLGVYVCSNLSWSQHVYETVKKANKVCNVILHAFINHDINLYMSAFNCYVEPILDYCCYVYNPVLCRDIDVIENVQQAFTRRAFFKCGITKMCYADRLNYLNVCSLEYSRFLTCLTLFYNVYHKHVVCNVLNDFKCPLRVHNLRGHNLRLFVPFCQSNVRKSFFKYRFARIWNDLPQCVVSSNVTKSFTNHIIALDMYEYYHFRY
jgi:hypothetical protein